MRALLLTVMLIAVAMASPLEEQRHHLQQGQACFAADDRDGAFAHARRAAALDSNLDEDGRAQAAQWLFHVFALRHEYRTVEDEPTTRSTFERRWTVLRHFIKAVPRTHRTRSLFTYATLVRLRLRSFSEPEGTARALDEAYRTAMDYVADWVERGEEEERVVYLGDAAEALEAEYENVRREPTTRASFNRRWELLRQFSRQEAFAGREAPFSYRTLIKVRVDFGASPRKGLEALDDLFEQTHRWLTRSGRQ